MPASASACHHGGVERRAVALQHARASGGAKSLVTKMSLCAMGTPSRAPAVPCGDARVGGCGLGQRDFGVAHPQRRPGRCARLRGRESAAPASTADTCLVAQRVGQFCTLRSCSVTCDKGRWVRHGLLNDLGHQKQATLRRRARCAGWLRAGWARLPRRRAGAAQSHRWRPPGGPVARCRGCRPRAFASTMSKKPLICASMRAPFGGIELEPGQIGHRGRCRWRVSAMKK